MRAAKAEWTALQTAMDETDPACHEWADLFTLDEPDESVIEFTTALCSECPLITLCRSYAQAARPQFGIWGGRKYPLSKRKGEPDEEPEFTD